MKFAASKWLPLLALIVIGIIPRIILQKGTVAILWPDSQAYQASGEIIADSGNFLKHEIYRTPIYPLFLSIFVSLFGHAPITGKLVLITQRLLGVVTGLILFAIAKREFNFWPAFLATCIFLLMPVQLYYETCVLTEALFTFLLFGGLLIGTKVIDRAQGKGIPVLTALLFGLNFGILTLTRPIGEFLFLFIATLALLYSNMRKHTSLMLICSLAIFFTVLAPWMVVNHKRFGFWGISREQGLNLYHRVLDIDQAPLPERTDHVIRRLYLKSIKKPGPTYFYVFLPLEVQYGALIADRRMLRFAWQVVKESPALYAKNTLRTLFQFFLHTRKSVHSYHQGDETPVLSSPKFNEIASDIFPKNRAVKADWAKRATYHLIKTLQLPPAIFGALFFIGAIVYIRRFNFTHPTGLMLLGTVIYFALITALFQRAEDRFRMPVDGIIILFGVYGAFALVTYVIRGYRALRLQHVVSAHT